MLKILRITEVVGMRVFTDSGEYLGVIEEAHISDNRIDGWRVRVSRDSALSAFLSGAKGLIIPHQYVKAFGEVLIISKSAIPFTELADGED